MNMTQVALKFGGLLSLLLALSHCTFYRAFDWKAEFTKTSPLAAHVLYTIHVFLIPFFLFFAYVAFFHTAELAGSSPLGLALSTFYSAFWLARSLWQITYLRPPVEGRIEKLMPLHYGLTAAFFVMSAAFALPLATHLFRTAA